MANLYYNLETGHYGSWFEDPIEVPEGWVLIPVGKPEGNDWQWDNTQMQWFQDKWGTGASPEEIREYMPPLAKWRFDTIIDSIAGLRAKIEAAIDRQLTDPLQNSMAKNKLKSVREFYRLDSLFPLLSSDPEINLSDDDIDVMWQQGLDLPSF